MTDFSLNSFARERYAANQHWWHDPATGEYIDRNRKELLMLVVSEIAEAMEGERKNLMDSHIPHRKSAEVELADAMIRLGDLAGADELDLDACDEFWHLDDTPENKSEALLDIVAELVRAAEAQPIDRDIYRDCIRDSIELIRIYAEKHGYDLDGAIVEKCAYNAVRADHRPENRLKAGGKAF